MTLNLPPLQSLDSRYFKAFDALVCLPFLIVPLLMDLPYRVNIFLSWEGAYRLYLGQLPFRDFSLPLGYGYWLIPALFFKIFGPTFMSLVKAQVLINAVSILSLRGILYNLKVKPYLVSLALIIFCVSYVLYNFWPWYNHSVVVYELAGMYFVTRFFVRSKSKTWWLNLLLGGFFIFLSFFTKQDGGAIGFVICLAVLAYHGLTERNYWPLPVFILSFAMAACLFILPFVQYEFLYWFNLGQEPHSSRVGLPLLMDVFFSQSVWEKIYLSLLAFLIIAGGGAKLRQIWKDRYLAVLTIISLGLIGQAIVTRASSPLPTDHMMYFHAFAVVLLASLSPLALYMSNARTFVLVSAIIFLSFSPGYWKYIKGAMGVSISKEDAAVPRNSDPWRPASFKGFDNVLMPKETVEGVQRLLALETAKKKDLKVLNMSELTPLALEMNYVPPVNQPLWYHLNIGIFQEQVEEFCQKVKNKEYDLVLFQDIPGLVHFFPYQVRDTLAKYYHFDSKFLAPRKLENSYVEVYLKPEAIQPEPAIPAEERTGPDTSPHLNPRPADMEKLEANARPATEKNTADSNLND